MYLRGLIALGFIGAAASMGCDTLAAAQGGVSGAQSGRQGGESATKGGIDTTKGKIGEAKGEKKDPNADVDGTRLTAKDAKPTEIITDDVATNDTTPDA